MALGLMTRSRGVPEGRQLDGGEVTLAIQRFESRAVRANQHGVVRHGEQGGDPVVLERGVIDGEIALDDVGSEDGDAAEGSGDQLARSARGSERVDVVVDETLEGVEAFGPGRPQEGDAGGCGQSGARTGEGDVGDVIGDEAVTMGEGLARVALCVEEHEAVGGRGVDGMALGVKHQAVDAEEVIVLEVADGAFRAEKVNPVIEEAYI